REPAEGAAEALARLEELVEQELAAARPAAGGDAHEVAPSRVASPCSSSRSWLATWARAKGSTGRLAGGVGGRLGRGKGGGGPVGGGVGPRPAAEPLVLEPVEDEDDRAVGLGVGL